MTKKVGYDNIIKELEKKGEDMTQSNVVDLLSEIDANNMLKTMSAHYDTAIENAPEDNELDDEHKEFLRGLRAEYIKKAKKEGRWKEVYITIKDGVTTYHTVANSNTKIN